MGIADELFVIFDINLLIYISFVVVFIYILWTRRKIYIASYKLPGPFALPLLGSIIIFKWRNAKEIFNGLLQCMKDYGKTYGLWIGPRFFIIISEPIDLEICLNHPDCFDKDRFLLKPMEMLFGSNLLTATAADWKPHRKILNAAFNSKTLNEFVKFFASNANIIVDNLKKNVAKERFDIYPTVFHAQIKFICATLFKTDVNFSDDVHNTLSKNLNRIMSLITARIFRPYLYPDVVFNSTSIGREFNALNSELGILVTKILKQKRQEYNLKQEIIDSNSTKENMDCDTDIKTSKQQQKLLDLLTEQCGIGFTETEVKSEINIFLIAGTETSAISASFVCLLLGAYPDIQEKAYAEINDIFGDSDRDVTVEDLMELKYLERVIKESLRILPTIPFTIRQIYKDIKLSTITVPAGTSLVLPYIVLHRDPEIWPNPLKFDPDRFLPEEVSKRHPYTYLPFGAGPRNCIGHRYAMLSMKTLLCTLLRTYRFKSNIDIANIRCKLEIALKPVNGFPVEIELRKPQQ